MTTPRLPPVLRLGPVVQLSPEAAWGLWHLATRGATVMAERDGLPPSPFTRALLGALAEAARHRDTDCRCARHGDTANGVSGSDSSRLLRTAEVAEVLGLSLRSVQRKRHEIGGFRRTTSGLLEFDPPAVQAYKQMRDRVRKERDG